MKPTLLILFAVFIPCANAGWIDTSQFHEGASWTYSRTSQSLTSGTLQSAYSGVQVWRIDSVKPGALLTSWMDSGITKSLMDSVIQVQRGKAWFGYDTKGFFPLSGDTLSAQAPLFAMRNSLDERSEWVVVGMDTLRTATWSTSPCAPTWIRYLEGWGLVNWTTTVACGLTSSSTVYTLLASEGRPYHDSLIKPLPKAKDFAPIQPWMHWTYQSEYIRESFQEPAVNWVARARDTLIWNVHLVSARSLDWLDSAFHLQVHVRGRSHIDSGNTTISVQNWDTLYHDTLQWKGGRFSLTSQAHPETCCLSGGLPKLNPIYHQHEAPLSLPAAGGRAGDSLVQGEMRKIISLTHANPTSSGRTVYAQGLGMLHRQEEGIAVDPPISADLSGMRHIWSLDTHLQQARVAPLLGEAEAEKARRFRESLRTPFKSHLLLQWLSRAYGLDGRLRSPPH